MKRLLTTTVCSIPLAFTSMAYAQTTPPPATETPPAQTAPGAPAPGAATPGTPAPGAPATGDTGTMGTPGTTDSPMLSPDSADPTETISGWSVKNSIMGQSVYNENDEKVGDVTDVVLGQDGSATHFVVGAGGFLGLGQHDVAIPFDEIQRGDDRLTLSGYTKDQLKNLPKVELIE